MRLRYIASTLRLWELTNSTRDSAGGPALRRQGAPSTVRDGVSLDGSTQYLTIPAEAGDAATLRGALTVAAVVRPGERWQQPGPVVSFGDFGSTAGANTLLLLELDEWRRPSFTWEAGDGQRVGCHADAAIPSDADTVIHGVRRVVGETCEAEVWAGGVRVAYAAGLPLPLGGSSPDAVWAVGAKADAEESPLYEGTIYAIRIDSEAASPGQIQTDAAPPPSASVVGAPVRSWAMLGDLRDEMGGMPLTPHGGPLVASDGVTLDGLGQYLTASSEDGDAAALSGDLTVSAVVQPSETWAQVGPLFAYGDFGSTAGANMLAVLELDEWRRPRFWWETGDGVAQGVTATVVIPTDQETVIHAVRRSIGPTWEAEVWVGPALVARATGLLGPLGGTSPDAVWCVGAQPDAEESPLYEGRIRSVRVVDAACDEITIQAWVEASGLPVIQPRQPVPETLRMGTMGALSPSMALRSTPLRAAAEKAMVSDAAMQGAAKVAWANAARVTAGASLQARDFQVAGVNMMEPSMLAGSILADRNAFPSVTLGRDALQERAGNEPFLYVRVTFPSGKTLHYSDIDRPVGRGEDSLQLDGRLLSLGYAARRMSPERALARCTTTLRIRNNDRAMDRHFRDVDNPAESYLRAHVDIWVGFRHLPRRQWKQVGGGWYFDKVEGLRAGHVDLALVDRLTDAFGEVSAAPTMRELKLALAGSAWIPRDYVYKSGRDNDNERVPVLFGAEWARATVLMERKLSDWAELRLVLGASKNPDAIPETWLNDVVSGRGAPWMIGTMREGSVGWENQIDARIYRGVLHFPTPSQAEGGRMHSRIIRVPVTTESGEQWYVAVLFLRGDTPPGAAVNTWQRGTKNDIDAFTMYWHTHRERVWVRFPWGAEGPKHLFLSQTTGWRIAPAWAGKHDPASIIRELASRYMGPKSISHIDHASFEELTSTLEGEGTTTGHLAGSIGDEPDGAAVIGKVAATFDLDAWWGEDSKIRIRPAGLARDDVTKRIPGAIVYDARWDIVRDSWVEIPPLGAERWGLANSFRLQGTKDHTPESLQREFTSDPDLVARHGRILETDVELAWWDSSHVWTAQARPYGSIALRGYFADNAYIGPPKGETARDAASPRLLVDHRAALRSRLADRARQRWIVRFRLPLYGMENDLGDYIRITHYAGTGRDGGYDKRLFRVEEVGLDWAAKQVEIVAVDCSHIDTDKPTLWDDADGWVRIKRDTVDLKHRVDFVTGSREAMLIGSDWRKAGIRPGDLLLIDDDKRGIHANLEVVEVRSDRLILDAPAPVSLAGGQYLFRVERTHSDPPDATVNPVRYKHGSDFFFRAADADRIALDGTVGAFADGTPGYRALQG